MMQRSDTRPDRAVRRRLGRRLWLAGAALLWERLWRALWPAVAIAGLFVSLALLDVLPVLPAWLHALILAAFAAAFALACVRLVRRLALPAVGEARHRLERDSGLDHRPLGTLEDSLATPVRDAGSRELWGAHRARLLAQIARLRVAAPRPGVAAADPLALRAAVALIFVVALAAGHADWRGRLGAALSPQWDGARAGTPVSLDLWINPPAYTALPPLYLATAPEAASPETVRVPVSSTLLAQVNAGESTPRLVIGQSEQPFEPIGADAYRVSAELQSGERIAVVQDGETLGEWTLDLIPDEPPDIEMTGPPARTARGVLRLDYEASDDYGVVSVTASIARVDRPEAEPLEIDLLLPGGDPRQVTHSSYHDLTAHPWAGLQVDVALSTEDAIGQRDVTYPARMVLPERIFNHPVARALVELRKRLTIDPDARFPVIRELSEIYSKPAHFYHDVVVALAIRIAERRLIYDPGEAAISEVQQLLWDTALHIEEGEFAVAERELREIQEALMRALAGDASDEEIAELMQQLRKALDRYLSALAEQLKEQLAQGEEMEPIPPDAELIGGEELRDMIERARELAESGARDAARELLAQLREMLENMQAGIMNQQFSKNEPGAWKMMEQMDSLMRRQQTLLDRSYTRAQRGQPQSGEERALQQQENLADAGNQENLRRELGQMMRQLADMLGEIPRPFGRAEQSMRDARNALEQDLPGQAVDPQTQALDQLQEGMRDMAQQIIEQMANRIQRGSGQLDVRPGQGRDPLGRRWGDGSREAVEGVDIPDAFDVQRAREILNELRRRRGERERPRDELEYIDRLLDRF